MTAEPETEHTPEPQETPEPDATSDPDRLPEDHPVVKALRKANKEAEEYRRQVREFEDAKKTEAEKLQERLTELETTARTRTSEAERLRVALDKGIPPALVDRLRGDTREDIEQDADALLELIADRPAELPRRPAERLRPGTGGTGEPPTDPQELADRLWAENRI